MGPANGGVASVPMLAVLGGVSSSAAQESAARALERSSSGVWSVMNALADFTPGILR